MAQFSLPSQSIRVLGGLGDVSPIATSPPRSPAGVTPEQQPCRRVKPHVSVVWLSSLGLTGQAMYV